MPLLVERLLQKKFDNDPFGLYLALQKKGDADTFQANGAGGLGKSFNFQETRDALDIDMMWKRVSMKAKNLEKLAKLARNYSLGHSTKGFHRNRNKFLICLALIVRHKTTRESYVIKSKAFDAMTSIYATQIGWKDQRTQGGKGVLILDLIEFEQRIFENEVLVFASEDARQKLANNACASTDSKQGQTSVYSPSYSYSPSQNEPHSESNSNSNSLPTPPSNLSLTPNSGSGNSIAHHSMSHSSGERKVSPSIDDKMRAERWEVKDVLKKMRKSSIPLDKKLTYQLNDIKATQKIFFKNNIFAFSPDQLWFLSGYMYDLQRNLLPDEHSFDDIRAENSRIRRLFGFRKGNTHTWQEVAAYLQALLLERLLTINRAEQFQKLALPTSEYHNWANLFRRSYSRYKWSTPSVLKRFRETCSETPERESPALPTRSMSGGSSPSN